MHWLAAGGLELRHATWLLPWPHGPVGLWAGWCAIKPDGVISNACARDGADREGMRNISVGIFCALRCTGESVRLSEYTCAPLSGGATTGGPSSVQSHRPQEPEWNMFSTGSAQAELQSILHAEAMGPSAGARTPALQHWLYSRTRKLPNGSRRPGPLRRRAKAWNEAFDETLPTRPHACNGCVVKTA